MMRERQIVAGGLIIRREGKTVLVATTPRQLRIARYLVRGE